MRMVRLDLGLAVQALAGLWRLEVARVICFSGVRQSGELLLAAARVLVLLPGDFVLDIVDNVRHGCGCGM